MADDDPSGARSDARSDERSDAPPERVERAIRFVPAEPQAVFDLLADPSQHALIDGSGSVKGALESAPRRLELGAKFGMSMKIGMPYRMTNEVVEFDEPSLIAWRHVGGHVWRYRIRPVDGGSEVTEEFDWRPSKAALFLRATGAPRRNAAAMEATLDRLAAHFAG